jgi:phosphoglycolate phosphatase
MKQTLIFDFDGTIADSMEALIDVFRDLTNYDKPLTKKDLEHFRRLPALQIAKELHIPLWRIPILVAKGRGLLSQKLGQVPIFDGIDTALATLQKQNYDLQIMSSNSRENVAAFLQRHQLLQYFSSIHGSVGLFSKAGVLKSIVRKQRLHLENCWYIGDEARDIEAAQKAHMRVAAVAWGFNAPELLEAMHPDVLVKSPKDLLQAFIASQI